MSSNFRIPITVLILCKNEEKAISDCIKSASKFDQIIVIDSDSTDNTVAMAKRHGAEVVNFIWNGHYPKKKQWALELEQIRHDWVLFLDSDERISSELSREIFDSLTNHTLQETAAIDIPLRYFFGGKYLHWGITMYKRSLINKKVCKFPEIEDLGVTNMWEVEGHYQPVPTRGEIRRFKNCIDHYDPDTLFDYFARHNRYSDWEAFLICNSRALEQVRMARTSQGRFFSRVPFKPILIFFYSYFLKLGIFDGRAGLDFALSRSFYYWQIELKVREIRRGRGAVDYTHGRTIL